MSSTIKIGDIEAKPGTKIKISIKLAETSGFELKLPIRIVNGAKPGPVLTIIAGIHPTEYPCMEGTIRLVDELDPKMLSGVFIGVPVFNIPGFQAKVPGSPLERTPLTSAFPGNPEGSMNERTAHFITTEILSKSNYAVEGHGCNFEEACPNHIIMRRTGNDELDKSSLIFARCFETEYVREAMEHHKHPIAEKGHSVMEQALKMNIPCILPEVGSAGGICSDTGQLNESDIVWFMDGIKNFMKKNNMIEGTAKLYDPWAVKNVLHFRTKTAGWFYPLKPNGGKIRKGDIIGEVRDHFGTVLEQIIAPVDGIISLIWTRPAVDQGSTVLQVFELGPKASKLF